MTRCYSMMSYVNPAIGKKLNQKAYNRIQQFFLLGLIVINSVIPYNCKHIVSYLMC